MKKLFLMFILLCTAVIGALAQTTNSPATLSGGWTREWSDEFTGASLNTEVWTAEQVTNPANNEPNPGLSLLAMKACS